MKIVKKFVFLVSIMFIMLYGSVAEAAPDTVKIINDHQIDSRLYFEGTHVRNSSYKKTSDGQVVYCADYDKEPPMLNYEFSYTNKGIKEDSRLTYILLNGYPNNSMTGNSDRDYYITAMSLWYFLKPDADIWKLFDLNNGTYNGASNLVVSEMAKLIKGAQNYRGASVELELIGDNSDSLGNSSYVTIEGVGTVVGFSANYTVSVEGASSGTYITDMSGNKTNSFSSGTHFLINVPVSDIETLYDGIDVNIGAVGSISKAYLYSVTNSIDYPNYQDVITLYSDEVDTGTTDSYIIEKPEEPGKLKISKRDATTGEELPGATLTLKDSSGNVIETWVSTDEVHIIEGLYAGVYTLTETIAPVGYISSTESVTFELKGDGSVNEVIMLNSPTVISVSKVDIASSEELAGAKLTIKDSEGNVVKSWVSTDKPYVIKGLAPGKYTLLEEIAPEGYELMEAEIEFTIGKDGKVTRGKTVVKDNLIIFENSPIPVPPPTGSTIIYIVLITGAVALGATMFLIFKKNKKI